MNGNRALVYGALSLLAAGQASTLLIENTTTRAVVQLVGALAIYVIGVFTPTPMKSKTSIPPPAKEEPKP